jgi:hypothetical protein
VKGVGVGIGGGETETRRGESVMGGVGRHGVTSNLLGEGKRAMTEQRLRINTTLTSLDLGGEGLFAVSAWDGRGMGGQSEGGRSSDVRSLFYIFPM